MVEAHRYRTQAALRFYSAWGPLGVVAALVAGLVLLQFVDGPKEPLLQLAFLLGLSLLPVAIDVDRHLSRLLRVVRRTGTTPVGEARPGYVELAGHAEVYGTPLRSPQSGQACVWHRIEAQIGKQIVSNASEAPVALRDASGRCVIDLLDAQVYGRLADVATVRKHYKSKEFVILPGDPLYAIGELAIVRMAQAPRAHGDAPPPSPPPAPERFVIDMLEHWQRDPAAFAKQFDANRDGTVDMREMLVARVKAAEFEKAWAAAPRPAAPAAPPPPPDTLTTVRVLRRPADASLPFLVMNRPAEAVERFLAWRVWAMRLMAAAGIVLAGAALRFLVAS